MISLSIFAKVLSCKKRSNLIESAEMGLRKAAPMEHFLSNTPPASGEIKFPILNKYYYTPRRKGFFSTRIDHIRDSLDRINELMMSL